MPHSFHQFSVILLLLAWLQLNVRGWLWARRLDPRRRVWVRLRASAGIGLALSVAVAAAGRSPLSVLQADVLVASCCVLCAVFAWRAHSAAARVGNPESGGVITARVATASLKA